MRAEQLTKYRKYLLRVAACYGRLLQQLCLHLQLVSDLSQQRSLLRTTAAVHISCSRPDKRQAFAPATQVDGAPLAIPHALLEAMRIFEPAEVELVPHHAVRTRRTGTGGVDDDVAQDVGHEAADGGAGGLLDVAVGQLIKGDGLAVLALVREGQAAAAFALVGHVFDTVLMDGDVHRARLPLDVVLGEARDAAEAGEHDRAYGAERPSTLRHAVVEIDDLRAGVQMAPVSTSFGCCGADGSGAAARRAGGAE